MNTLAITDLMNRVRRDTTYAPTLYRTITDAANITMKMADAVEKVSKDRNLSDEGRRAKVVDHAKELLRELVDTNRHPRSVVAQVAARRRDFKPKPLDRDDAVGQGRHAEMRAYLRKLPTGQRMQASLELALDADALEAVLSAPPALSGFTGHARAHFDELNKLYVSKRFGEQAAEVDAIEEDAAAATAAVQMAMFELQKASGIQEHAFNRLAKTYEEELDAKYKPVEEPKPTYTEIKFDNAAFDEAFDRIVADVMNKREVA